MCLRALIICGVFGVVLAPIEARADWFVHPFIGGAFGGGVAEAPKVDYGLSGGWMGKAVGFEVDVSHRPDFFKVSDLPDVLFRESSVTSVMFNGLYAVPFGQVGRRLRPYAAGGVGWLRSRIGGDDDFIRGNDGNVGFNVGGGIFSDLTDRVGLRGDLRYFRDLQQRTGQSEFFNMADDKLDFWRLTGGVTFRF